MKKKERPGIKNNQVLLFLLFFLIPVSGCDHSGKKNEDQASGQTKLPVISIPEFSPDSALVFAKMQTDFGFRIPNTPSHVQCGDYLIATMKKYADTVYVQATTVKAFDGKELHIRNIISSYKPELKSRVMLCAHWDSRPFADQDTADQDKPILAANDGAASCAVLMEIGRLLKSNPPDIGIDIIFFDAEDYGQPESSSYPHQEDSYCLGSQYWAGNPHVPGYFASYGILLDMVGAENATFTKEGTSMQYASSIVDKVWGHASRIGFSDYFIFKETAAIIDDHYYINQLMHIPVIDIVHRDAGTRSNFWKYWHTHQDTPDKLNKNSLKAVGQTLLETIFMEGHSG